MALRSEGEGLAAAWRALAGSRAVEGWRTIPIVPVGPCRLLAGRHFPGNEEALLVGFANIRIPPPGQLPQGRGFVVSEADLGHQGVGRVWIALCRQSAGSLDLFSMMADDVVATLEALKATEEDRVFKVLLGRIWAWQDFMQQGGDGVLGPDAEVGLFGELETLRSLLSAGLPASVATDAWQGPLDSVHDFILGTGAIEVKSTVSPGGFSALINSLEQLDDSLTRPLFLAAVRLALHESGLTLPEQVEALRDRLREHPAAVGRFDSRLLHAGFLDAAADRYSRRFHRVQSRLLPVSEGFPRLTKGNVPIQVRGARYELDLDLVVADDVALEAALQQLGLAL
jgi:hypothetical protein